MDQALLEIQAIIKKMTRKQGVLTKDIDYFPEVKSYLQDKFGHLKLDLNSVIIILCPESIMDSYGFGFCGGCYIEGLNTIISRKRIQNLISKKSPYYEYLKTITGKIDKEDIIVHEMIHAVSAMSKRSNRNYRNNEEEFVYTNCVDFYKNKGMTEEYMVNNIFLPFILNDISDEIYETKFNNNPNFFKEFNRYLRDNSKDIVNRATERGMKMVELYRSYGSKIKLSNTSTNKGRFSMINLDD